MSLVKSQSLVSAGILPKKVELSTHISQTVHKSSSSPISRSRSGSLIDKQYIIAPLSTGKNTKTSRKFVINIEGCVGKLKSLTDQTDFDPYDVEIIEQVICKKRDDFMVEWIHFEV